ncbi:MAG: hypothetical protein SF029_24005 [bacterium]|nr:hypothetical protein [bacterium]
MASRIGMLMLMLMGIILAAPTYAQGEAAVEIVPSASAISTGETFTADVFIRSGAQIAGADVQLEVVGDCLQIEALTPGDYLPTSAETGGFAPVNRYDATSARLAANITNRQRIASGDGLFMRVQLRALCEAGASTLQISRAELVNDQGEQFTAATTPLQLTIAETTLAANLSASLETSSEPTLSNTTRTLGLGLIATAFLGAAGLIGWLVFGVMRRRA